MTEVIPTPQAGGRRLSAAVAEHRQQALLLPCFQDSIDDSSKIDTQALLKLKESMHLNAFLGQTCNA